ncbi:hypothetical protein P3W75_17505, partial [Pseudomonas citronellolis]|nr:hypothetical protein [Pseudomonas citronellolis]
MNIIDGLSGIGLATKLVRGVVAGASEFASYLANASATSASATTSGTSDADAGAVASTGAASQGGTGSLDQFLAYMKLSPGEKLRYSVMQDMNVTQDQLDAMPAEERERVENEIAQRIREKITQQADSGSQPVAPTATPVALKQMYSGERAQPSVD